MIEEFPTDPTPRSYPSMVELLRRGSFDSSNLNRLSVAEVEAWMLNEAVSEEDLLALFQAFIWRLVATDLPIVRASLHVGTLHPQLFGYAWNWNSDDGFCDEVKVDEASLSTDAYRKNPLFRVIEDGEQIRSPTDSPEAAKSPLLRELRDSGITEYNALPLRAHGAYHNAATVATRQAGGFSTDQFELIERFLRLFALHVETHIEARISKNIVTTYLGAQAGKQVLNGTIKRGAGTSIDAVIWASDLRGFTELAERLDDKKLTKVLNVYFARLVDSIMDNDGEVLKFIGDGLLAVFPFDTFGNKTFAAEAAVDAAKSAISLLDNLNHDTKALEGIDGWRPLKTGIALHVGEVFFGNVGAPQRLDFTVIGKAVNTVSRVEPLTKETGYPILVTDSVRDLSSQEFVPLGSFELKGLDEVVSVFGYPFTGDKG